MKNKNAWYLGYLISLVLLVVILKGNLDKSVQIALIVLFSSVLAVANVKVLHENMIKRDKEYKILYQDERYSMIKDKVNSMNSTVLLFLIGIVTVVFIVYEYYLPAILTSLIIISDPIIMIFISRFYEKRY